MRYGRATALLARGERLETRATPELCQGSKSGRTTFVYSEAYTASRTPRAISAAHAPRA